MQRLMSACAVLVLGGCAAASDPLMAPMGAMQNATANAANAPVQKNAAYLAEQYAIAQDAASRRGDEDLTCDQLQTESNNLASDPKIAETNEKIRASAEARLKAGEAMRAVNSATYAGVAVASAAAPITGGVNWLGLAAMYAQNGLILGETVVMNRGGGADIAKELGGLMSTSARNERVLELASDKDCPFMMDFKAAQAAAQQLAPNREPQ